MSGPDLLKSIQVMSEEPESSRQSRLRAWEVLQKFGATLSDLEGFAIPPPPRKTFDAEGKLLNDTCDDPSDLACSWIIQLWSGLLFFPTAMRSLSHLVSQGLA
jgi:hypothetical protein